MWWGLTCVWSHCLSRDLTASRVLSRSSSTCRPLRAIETGGLDGEATTPGLSISFTFFKMCTSCMDLRAWNQTTFDQRNKHLSTYQILQLMRCNELISVTPITRRCYNCVQSMTFFYLYHSLCDASLDTNRACQDLLHAVDDAALSHIRKTWELKITSKNQHTTTTKSQDKTPHQKKSPYKIGAAMLTNYAHFECSIILCVSSQTCQELCETAASEAGCCSGSIQDIIGGPYPALPGMLMKTEGQYKVNPTHNKQFFFPQQLGSHCQNTAFTYCVRKHASALLMTEP